MLRGAAQVKKDRDGQQTLSISSDLQLIRVGTSADFGFCQGRKRVRPSFSVID